MWWYFKKGGYGLGRAGQRCAATGHSSLFPTTTQGSGGGGAVEKRLATGAEDVSGTKRPFIAYTVSCKNDGRSMAG